MVDVKGPEMNTHAHPSKLIRGATGDWEVVIGMEVHAQVISKSKLFSGHLYAGKA